MPSRKPRRRSGGGKAHASAQAASRPTSLQTTAQAQRNRSAPAAKQTTPTVQPPRATQTAQVAARDVQRQEETITNSSVATATHSKATTAQSLPTGQATQATASMPLISASTSILARLRESVAVGTAELALRRYVRSKWLPIDLVLLLTLFLICFRFPFGAAYFYDISTFGLGATIVVTAYALVHQLLPPITYLRLGLRGSLRGVFAGLALAMALISLFLILLLLFLALVTQRFAGTSVGALLAGGIGLVANCLLLGTLTIVLATPATNMLLRLGFLVWLVLAFASYNADGALAVLLFPARLLLLPFAVCYNFGVTGVIGWAGLLALVAQAAYIAGLIWFAGWMLKRKLQRRPHLAQEL